MCRMPARAASALRARTRSASSCPTSTASSSPRSCAAWTARRAAAAICCFCPTCTRGRAQAAHALRAMRGRVDGLIVMAPHLGEEELAAALPQGTAGDADQHARRQSAHRRRSTSTMPRARARSSSISSRSAASASSTSPGPQGQYRRRGTRRRVSRGAGAAAALELRSHPGRLRGRIRRGGDRARCSRQAPRSTPSSPPTTIWRSARCRRCATPDSQSPTRSPSSGFDDIPLARHLGLTTVRVRIAELGERALERLLEHLERR